MSSPRININRLLALAALLRGLPDKAFCMDDWVAPEDALPKLKKAKCGMTCCIGGWATCVHPDLMLYGPGLRLQNARNFSGLANFAEAFGLDQHTAFGLTDSDALHKTPEAAARAVEAVAADLAAEHDYEIVEVSA